MWQLLLYDLKHLLKRLLMRPQNWKKIWKILILVFKMVCFGWILHLILWTCITVSFENFFILGDKVLFNALPSKDDALTRIEKRCVWKIENSKVFIFCWRAWWPWATNLALCNFLDDWQKLLLIFFSIVSDSFGISW